MKILLVTQNRIQWAPETRAKVLKKEWINDEVDIVDRWNLPDGDKYDVIHFLYSGAITKVKDYILKYKNKVFTTLASQRTLDYLYDDKDSLIEIYKNTCCCVCHNPRLLSKLYDLIGQSNMVYIPNGIDENLFNRKFIVGHVGTKDSSEHKGLGLVKDACKDLGLELKVLHEKYRTYEEMPEFYKEIDCLVIPSLSEGCNNPTLESLAMNKPVISTDVGIARELEGVIIVNRNVESIKKALRKLSGRIQILEKFTWKEIAKQYYKIYENRTL